MGGIQSKPPFPRKARGPDRTPPHPRHGRDRITSPAVPPADAARNSQGESGLFWSEFRRYKVCCRMLYLGHSPGCCIRTRHSLGCCIRTLSAERLWRRGAGARVLPAHGLYPLRHHRRAPPTELAGAPTAGGPDRKGVGALKEPEFPHRNLGAPMTCA